MLQKQFRELNKYRNRKFWRNIIQQQKMQIIYSESVKRRKMKRAADTGESENPFKGRR